MPNDKPKPPPKKPIKGKPLVTRAAVEPLIGQTYGNYAGIAAILRVSRQAVWAFIQSHPDLLAAMESERERVTDVIEKSLQNQAIKGQGWAVCFYLKTQARHRGYVERPENLPPLDMLLAALPDDIREDVRNAIAQALQPK